MRGDKIDGAMLSGILAAGSSFRGILIFEGILRIDGIITGKIICRPGSYGSLIIGEQAQVDVDLLVVDNLTIGGQFYGNGPIIVLEEAEFYSKSRVEVSKHFALYSSHLTIKEKALFQGKSVMIRHESPEKKAQIKSFIFDNRVHDIKEPFLQNPVISRIATAEVALEEPRATDKGKGRSGKNQP